MSTRLAQSKSTDPRYPALTQVMLTKLLRNVLRENGTPTDDLSDEEVWPLANEAEKLRARTVAGEWVVYREGVLEKIRRDPLRYGYEPETFKLVRDCLAGVYGECNELLVSGANREGKSTICYKLAVEELVMRPEAIVGIFEATERASKLKQQPRIHKMLPPEWRDVGIRGPTAYVKFKQQTGFPDGQFVLPAKEQGMDGSTGIFFNYMQDVGIFEGHEFDMVLFEENLRLSFLQTMRYRVAENRKLKILINFTPKWGFTPVVKDILNGMVILKTARAKLLPEHQVLVKGCPPGHMPVIMRCDARKSMAVFFHSGTNAMGQGDQVAEKLVGATAETIMIRAYGWAPRMEGGAFPKYGKDNRITRKQFDEIAAKGGLRFRSIDPHGRGKNWFIKWYFMTPKGDVIVYREWPDFKHYGEWAMPGEQTDWKAGPAQRNAAGLGMRGYKKMILEAEGGIWHDDWVADPVIGCWDLTKAEKIERTFMDPRMGGSPVPGVDEGTTILEMAFDRQLDDKGRVVGPAMDWEAAPASGVEETTQMIADRLEYDDTKPVTAENSPHWFIVDDLVQTDTMMREWTGLGSEKCALKDILDPDRYFVKVCPDYIESGSETMVAGGCY